MKNNKREFVDGVFIKHEPCPKCRSKDNLAIYEKENDDGEVYYDACCWTTDCGYMSPKELQEHYPEYESGDGVVATRNVKTGVKKLSQEDFEYIESLPSKGSRKRKLKQEMMALYGVKVEAAEDGKILKHYYPETKSNEVTGYHTRTLPKDFKAIGDVKGCQLFGQHLYESGKIQYSKRNLIITEGHLDCVAVQQVMTDNGDPRFHTPVVSITSGAGNAVKEIERNYRFVNSFDNIILMFDNDKPGKEAADSVAKKMPIGKCKISSLPAKDPCDLLKEGREQELFSAYFKAETYSPAGVVGSSSTWDALVQRAKWEKISLPPFARQLQEMLNGGPALGEITTIAGASSVGKTSILNEFLYHWIMSTNYKVGVISLESDTGELIENLLGLHINKKLAMMDDDEKLEFYETEGAKEAHRELTTLPDGSDRFLIVEHNGDVIDDKLQKQMEYLVNGCGCKITLLDPMTLALSGEGNEGVDAFMSWLLRFVKNNQISHFNVVHVRKNSGNAQANSRGAEISEEMIKGSGSQFQVSMNNILIMRDKVNEDERVRNTTKVVCSKNRRCGNCGPAGFWFYNAETSRLERGNDPDDETGYMTDEELFNEAGAYNDSNPDEVIESIESGTPFVEKTEKEELY